MKITYWSDYACPYCYIGEKRLQKAIDKLNIRDFVKLEMRSFELDPTASNAYVGTTVDRFAKKYGLTTEEASEQIEYISSLGRQEGIDFQYADTRYTNTRDAHRLTKLAAAKLDSDKVDSVIHALFDAYFTKNEELSNRDVLVRIGTSVGLNESEIISVLDSDAYVREVVQDEQLANQIGFHGVPFFVIDNQYVLNGAQSQTLFEEALQKAFSDSMKDIFTEGASCGINGCK